ncbi:uncharacterized protein LOC116948209 [Petromyzon marinus]|uniref:uncharacterized protein LOC116948209 n=1 Tax=Petromyzon marinus TaxID=7757 RepID=UPI003F708EA0
MCDLMLNLDVSVVPENGKSRSRQHARDIRFMKGNKARERRDNLRHQKFEIQQSDTIQHLDKQNVKFKPESQTKSYLKKSHKEMKDTLNGTIKHSGVKLQRKNEKTKGHAFDASVHNNMLDEFSNGAARPEKQVTVTEDVPQTFANKNPSRYFGLDCEMVGTGPAGVCSELARCSIVTYYGDVVYDRYVQPRNPITDYRTRWSGITAKDLSKAIPFHRAKKEIVQILKDKVVVGHALHNDFKVIGVTVPESLQRDTSRSKLLRSMAGLPTHRITSLKILAKTLLKEDIQMGTNGHSSVEDAWSAMQLFRLIQIDWEKELDEQAQEKPQSIKTRVAALPTQKAVNCKVEGKVTFKPKVKNMMEKSSEELFKCLNLMLGKDNEHECKTGKDLYVAGTEKCIAREEKDKRIKECEMLGKTDDKSLVTFITTGKKRKHKCKVVEDRNKTANLKKPYSKKSDGSKHVVFAELEAKDEAEPARKKKRKCTS